MEARVSFKTQVQHAMGMLSGKVNLVRDLETGMVKLQVETPRQEVSSIYIMPADDLLKAMRALLIDGADTLAKLNALITAPPEQAKETQEAKKV